MKRLKFLSISGLCLSVSLLFAEAQQTPVLVNVVKVTSQNVTQTIDALGSLSAKKDVTISSETAGRVQKVYFKDGQQVSEGMPIIQLDDAQAKAQYESALAELHLSRHKYDRSKLLLNQAISKQALEQLQATMDTDEATVKSQQVLLNQKQITAPFSGTLGKFLVHEGDYVTAGTPLVNLVNADQLQVDFNVPQDQRSALKEGQLVNVTVNAYPDKTFYGTVNFISPTVDSNSRTVAVQATLPNKKGLLSPGMFVHVAQQVKVDKDALVVPQQATLADIKGYYVYVVEGNKVAKTYVKTGANVGAMIQIVSGLKKGQQVVVAGTQKLSDGSLIKIAPTNDES